MSVEDFIIFLEVPVILILYWVFFIYLPKKKEGDKTEWKKRIKAIEGESPVRTGEGLTLLKEQPIADTYFKSKIPRVEGLKEWIQHAGLNTSPRIFIFLSGCLGLSIAIAFILIFGTNILFSILFGLFCSFVIPWIIIKILSTRLKNQFLEEFPIALDIIRRALKVGHSVDRTLEMVAEQSSGIVGEVFRTAIDKMRLGEPFEVVFGDLANRLGIDDFRMLSIVLTLQRETGGSLAEAIDNFAKIIRARSNLRKKVKALTAEVRMTAIILTCIPFFIFGAIYFSSPTYLDPLFYTERGHYLLIIGAVMLISGITIIMRMAYKETY